MDTIDIALVARTLEGSLEAYDQLMRRYERLVYRVARGFAGTHEGALDISQEVFLKAYRKLSTLDAEGSFKAWLIRIAYRESSNWLRAERRRGEHVELEGESQPEISEGPDNALLRGEQRSLVLEALERINPRGRRAVFLRYYEDRPIREVAALLDCSEGVAKNILFRSVRRVRDALGASR